MKDGHRDSSTFLWWLWVHGMFATKVNTKGMWHLETFSVVSTTEYVWLWATPYRCWSSRRRSLTPLLYDSFTLVSSFNLFVQDKDTDRVQSIRGLGLSLPPPLYVTLPPRLILLLLPRTTWLFIVQVPEPLTVSTRSAHIILDERHDFCFHNLGFCWHICCVIAMTQINLLLCLPPLAVVAYS